MYKRNISGIEENVISLYLRGMSTRDIHDQFKDIYGIDLSTELVSKITKRIVPEIKEWQNRLLDPIYPFVFMDAIHYKIRDNGSVVSKAAYVVLGNSIGGNKYILGIWIGESESSKFWLGVFNELKNRGEDNILVFCVDRLTSLKEAISAAFPKAEIQRCIIHQLKNSFKYVSYKDSRAFSRDFKKYIQQRVRILLWIKFISLKKSGENNIHLLSKAGRAIGMCSVHFLNIQKKLKKSFIQQI